jgi:hypothetical protein
MRSGTTYVRSLEYSEGLDGSKSQGGSMIQIEVAQEILKQIESGECTKALLIEAKTIDLTFLGYPLVYDVTVTLE